MNPLDLAPVGGALASVGFVLLYLGRTPNVRLGGFGLGIAGACLLGVPLAPSGHEGFVIGVFVVAAVLAAGLGLVLRRWPWLLAFLTLLLIPARIPMHIDGLHGKFLLPLYLLAGGAAVQLAIEFLQGDERSRELGPLAVPLSAWILWVGLSMTWSRDVHSGAVELLAFYVPFGIIALGLARLPWSRRALSWLGVELVAMAVLFSLIGIWQHQTKSVFWNPKVITGNAYAPFFRVNSVFWDPSIYGRFLVTALLVLLVVVVRGRGRRLVLGAAATIVLVWYGLFLSYSQTSFASLAAGIVLLALVAWGRRATPAAVLAILVLLVGIAAAPRIRHSLLHNLNHATSGRANLVSGGIRIARENPVMGAGVGGFRRAYADIYHLKGKEPKKAASHDTPVTVAAENGLVGFALYAWLLGAALVASFRWIGRRFDSRVSLSLGLLFVAIFVHSLAYADFFEDPMLWSLLGLIPLAWRVLAEHAATRARPPAEALEPVPFAAEDAEAVRP